MRALFFILVLLTTPSVADDDFCMDGLSSCTLAEQTFHLGLKKADEFFFLQDEWYPTIRPDQFSIAGPEMFKQLWIAGGNPAETAKKVGAITAYGKLSHKITIYLRPQTDFRKPEHVALLVHELYHVYQNHQYLLGKRPQCTIPYEREAYAIQEQYLVYAGVDPEYLKRWRVKVAKVLSNLTKDC